MNRHYDESQHNGRMELLDKDGIDDIINSCYQEHVDAMEFFMREEDSDGEPIDLDDPFTEKCLLISMVSICTGLI